jgi:oligopeptide/dipeptide ABC transporter ATP-binding protein
LKIFYSVGSSVQKYENSKESGGLHRKTGKIVWRCFPIHAQFIALDLCVVEHVCDHIAVMYLGKVVEIAKDKQLYANPLHPYTQALLSAITQPNPRRQKRRIIISGEVPSPIDPPSGCRFHPRCPVRKDICLHDETLFRSFHDEHFVACHLV